MSPSRDPTVGERGRAVTTAIAAGTAGFFLASGGLPPASPLTPAEARPAVSWLDGRPAERAAVRAIADAVSRDVAAAVLGDPLAEAVTLRVSGPGEPDVTWLLEPPVARAAARPGTEEAASPRPAGRRRPIPR